MLLNIKYLLLEAEWIRKNLLINIMYLMNHDVAFVSDDYTSSMKNNRNMVKPDFFYDL